METAFYSGVARAAAANHPVLQHWIRNPFPHIHSLPHLALNEEEQGEQREIVLGITQNESRCARIALRTAIMDYWILQSVKSGIETQLVLLGSGYDTRAWRLELGDSVVTFEIDLLPVIDSKKEWITRENMPKKLCRSVRFVPADVVTSEVWSGLQQNGWLPSIRTVWLCEGLLMYIEPENVVALLKRIAGASAEDSELILHLVTKSGGEKLIDPPALFTIETEKSAAFLEECGWRQMESVRYEQGLEMLIKARYAPKTETNAIGVMQAYIGEWPRYDTFFVRAVRIKKDFVFEEERDV